MHQSKNKPKRLSKWEVFNSGPQRGLSMISKYYHHIGLLESPFYSITSTGSFDSCGFQAIYSSKGASSLSLFRSYLFSRKQRCLLAEMMASMVPYFFIIFWWWLWHCGAVLVFTLSLICKLILTIFLSFGLRRNSSLSDFRKLTQLRCSLTVHTKLLFLPLPFFGLCFRFWGCSLYQPSERSLYSCICMQSDIVL